MEEGEELLSVHKLDVLVYSGIQVIRDSSSDAGYAEN